eukprot:CAMPEP_0172669328 /NCGR_PEP_ID=MMETSP1074-20121228/9609_1 /TAXON_ID=2916 /ORGANISM="Ceratium fusus, Strain PA161109" /LENGTH=518 /DNA_ID=CAMNT_0013486087 /DNA_START=166 /DNA_END=1722 /DNA_ORIENTATION=+
MHPAPLYHANTYASIGPDNGLGLRQRRAFPELRAVRGDKLMTATKEITMGVDTRVPFEGPAQPSNARILQGLLMTPLNLLVLAGLAGIYAAYRGFTGAAVFCLCFLGLVPVAKLLGDATDHLAENLNETIGGLLNATFGNAVEMILTISLIAAGELRMVKQSLLGSILSNLLLVLGMAFFAGGMSRPEQVFSDKAALINVTMLLVGLMAFCLPSVFSLSASASEQDTLTISRTCAIFVAIGYVAYLVFQLYTHTEFFDDAMVGVENFNEDVVEFIDTEGDMIRFQANESGKVNFLMNGRLKVCDLTKLELSGRTLILDGVSSGDWGSHRVTTVPVGQEGKARHVLALWRRCQGNEDGGKKNAVLSIPWALALLLVSTVVVAVLSEYMVDSINELVSGLGVPKAFVGVVLLPIVGNACEHISAVRMAYHNKVATAIAIAIGSSTQIALFVMPFSVILASLFNKPLDLALSPPSLAVLFMSVLVVFSIVMDGKSNWLEGFMLTLSYCLVAVLYWCMPNGD